MRKFFISLYLTLLFFTLFSQEQGYKIRFELAGVDAQMLYVKGNYGYQYYIFDSIKPYSKSVYLLENKKRIIPDGIYELIDRQKNSYAEFIVSQNRHFTIKIGQNHSVTGSDENIFFALVRSMKDYETDYENIRQFVELAPQSLLSKYLKAKYLNGEIQDARLLHTPIYDRLDALFNEIFLKQHPDTINKEIDKLIAGTGNNDEIKRYYLQYLYKTFDTGAPEYDGVIVHLYDCYCPDGTCDWLDENFNRRIKREALRKRKTLVGQIVPPLEVYVNQEEKISSESITNQYTVLWFWDPDCEGCIEETPKLYAFYENFHTLYDFEVMAISITEDYDRWRKFIPQIPNWINASIAVGETNYDFSDYFDLLTTPGIFIIDKEHKIIARQFPLEEIFTIFED